MPRVNIKDKRRQQLMEANIASIARHGLADTTIAHVSKGAGMSRGIVNFYFTSKEKMMRETLQFLAEEVTAVWQGTLAAEREKGSDPIAIAETILRVLMSDRLCSSKRMTVWAEFIGHAGTHTAFSRIINGMDSTLNQQLKKLWQDAGYDAKTAQTHARQLQALIRGHWLMGALSDNELKPSAFIEAWVSLLRGVPLPAEPHGKVVQLKSKKQTAPDLFSSGDLFSKE